MDKRKGDSKDNRIFRLSELAMGKGNGKGANP
jgi:hypothetical protein